MFTENHLNINNRLINNSANKANNNDVTIENNNEKIDNLVVQNCCENSGSENGGARGLLAIGSGETGGGGGFARCNGLFPAVVHSPFSAFHLLRNYNCFNFEQNGQHLIPHNHQSSGKHLPADNSLVNRPLLIENEANENPKSKLDPFSALSLDLNKSLITFPPTYRPAFPEIFTTSLPSPHNHFPLNLSSPNSYLLASKRQRGEKKPIPDNQKDEKYFERRRRNNQAAKKSRDARKIREDRVALRAALLEHENAILKAQILTLREEATNLRQMLMQKNAKILQS